LIRDRRRRGGAGRDWTLGLPARRIFRSALKKGPRRAEAEVMRIAVAAIFSVFVLAPAAASAHEQAGTRQLTLEAQLAQQVNAVRREQGLKPLRVSEKLAAAATAHTREMGTNGYFEHASFDSTPFWKRVARWYPSRGWRSWSVGENLLYSSPDVTAESSVEMWMNSPPHRANLLSRSWREIGISAIHFEAAPGEYDGAPVTIVTADFGARRQNGS
jgi:uncharacterized protein YkwD